MRQALGRGLEALIPSTNADQNLRQEGGNPVQKILISQIHPNHLQPRKNFDPEKLSGLAQSIKENGLAQPIVVSFDAASNSYELIAGERRFRASQLAGLTQIDAIVRNEMPDKQRLALTMIENLQREDLNPIEEALGYLRLMKEFSMTQTEVCDSLGKSKSAVSNTLRLLSLPEEIQKGLQNEQITEGHARAILMLKEPIEMIELYRVTVGQHLSVREVEDRARRSEGGEKISGKKSRAPEKHKSSDLKALENSLQQHLGTRVEIKIGKDPYQGTITVHFFSLSDFDKVVAKLKK